MFQIFIHKFFNHHKYLPDTEVKTLTNGKVAHLDSLPCICEIIEPLECLRSLRGPSTLVTGSKAWTSPWLDRKTRSCLRPGPADIKNVNKHENKVRNVFLRIFNDVYLISSVVHTMSIFQTMSFILMAGWFSFYIARNPASTAVTCADVVVLDTFPANYAVNC